MKSAVYVGQVRHRRLVPVEHAFTYRLYMMYLDLAELPRVFDKRWLWSASRPALARFRRRDHLGDPAVPLDHAVRDLVEKESGERPAGPIRLLTQLRHCGYVFNPVSFYYCFDRDDKRVEAIVAEVNNTPWGERHCYVLPQSRNRAGGGRHRHGPEKVLHVSPFMPMDIDYDWRFNPPGERLTVHMENARAGEKLFDATLVLERRPITAAALAGVLLRFPLMTARIITAIHWQALKLWLKRVPVYDHPAKRARTAGRTR